MFDCSSSIYTLFICYSSHMMCSFLVGGRCWRAIVKQKCTRLPFIFSDLAAEQVSPAIVRQTYQQCVESPTISLVVERGNQEGWKKEQQISTSPPSSVDTAKSWSLFPLFFFFVAFFLFDKIYVLRGGYIMKIEFSVEVMSFCQNCDQCFILICLANHCEFVYNLIFGVFGFVFEGINMYLMSSYNVYIVIGITDIS